MKCFTERKESIKHANVIMIGSSMVMKVGGMMNGKWFKRKICHSKSRNSSTAAVLVSRACGICFMSSPVAGNESNVLFAIATSDAAACPIRIDRSSHYCRCFASPQLRPAGNAAAGRLKRQRPILVLMRSPPPTISIPYRDHRHWSQW